MMVLVRPGQARRRSGITLTEILIAIMILGVGLVSLATLFPIGLLRLRDAARYSRTKYLVDSAAADGSSRALFSPDSFALVDQINYQYSNPQTAWWFSVVNGAPVFWSPLTSDTAFYGDFPQDPNDPGVTANSYGLTFAYDPLWRFQTIDPNKGVPGYYLDPVNQTTFEARFGSGLGFIRQDPNAISQLPSAHGLQRITNFTYPAFMPAASAVPSIFVSQEDVVWVENVASSSLSPILPDLDPTFTDNKIKNQRAPAIDWRYSWMFTGYQVGSAGGATFEGNIVVFENRPFGIVAEPNPPNPTGLPNGATYRVAGETVVEAIFGHSAKIVGGYGAGADRTVLLRWYASEADPVVKPGDWIADVTYERHALVVYNPQTGAGRFMSNPNGGGPGLGVENPFNNGEWDNLPAQRCFWYQVQKVTQAIDDVAPMRSMVVYVDRSLQARTLLNAPGSPVYYNAALISPYVVNVIPQQFTVK
jgi:hypothetical protein